MSRHRGSRGADVSRMPGWRGVGFTRVGGPGSLLGVGLEAARLGVVVELWVRGLAAGPGLVPGSQAGGSLWVGVSPGAVPWFCGLNPSGRGERRS